MRFIRRLIIRLLLPESVWDEDEVEEIEAMVPDPNLANIGPTVRFDERCQALRTVGRCKRPADTFCLHCSLHVCSECRPEHLMLYVRQGAILTLTCDGRTIE